MAKQPLAIALCRVSSIEQLESDSLNHQKDNVLKAAEELGVTIPQDGIWSGHVSSKKGVNYNRRDLKEMLEYCHKFSAVKYLIVQEVDRFMRSPDEQIYFQVKFMNEVGVKIWYADKPELNKDDIYAGLMRYMEGFRAAGSNDERQRKSINGQTKALMDGRYPFSPKPGYKRGHEKGIQEVHPVRGPALKTALTRLATRMVTPTQALIELN
jgi:DNA invertase Pin-like site-specific DNA recombinase